MNIYKIFTDMRKLPKGFIIDNPHDLIYTNFKLSNKILNIINYLSVVSLILSAIINMNFRILHLTLASIFFLLSTLYIFLYGYFYKNIRYSVSLLSMFVVSINTILILLVFYFDISYGLFEVFFILNLITWYLFMIKKVIK